MIDELRNLVFELENSYGLAVGAACNNSIGQVGGGMQVESVSRERG